MLGFPETFKALSDPIRREKFNMTNATISYHLSQLKKAGLIFETKYKNFIFYEINISVFEEVMLWFSQFMEKGEKDNEKSDK